MEGNCKDVQSEILALLLVPWRYARRRTATPNSNVDRRPTGGPVRAKSV